MKKFTIGTRGSLLARAQAQFIKSILEKTTDHQFELKIIKTQGDQIQDKPLWQLEGKDFFTKELDSELLEGSIDLVVHSFKDLGGERPEGIHLAAVTKRANPADLLVIKKETAVALIEKKFSSKDFVVGTSSPRRISQAVNLNKYLPHGSHLKIETKNLRGNVDTRIGKLLSGDYNAILLAAAGLERITYSEDGLAAIKNYSPHLTYMILPTNQFTPAPAQGALAIDCRSDHSELINILQKLQDPITREEVLSEKESFQEYGGGCHLPMGIYCKSYKEYFYIKKMGKDSSDKLIDSTEYKNKPESLKKIGPNSDLFLGVMKNKNWENALFDQMIEKKPITNKNNNPNHFFATRYGLNSLKESLNAIDMPPLFAAGSSSMKVLAENGFWCHGTVNSLGDKGLKDHINSQTFNLFHDLKANWGIYTHNESQSSLGEIIPSYERKVITTIDSNWEKRIKKCKFFYWASYPQYEEYCERFDFLKNPEGNSLYFFTGVGKTEKAFAKNKIPHTPLVSVELLRPYIKGYQSE